MRRHNLIGPVQPKPTVPEVLPLVRDLYGTEHGGAGGCLHIVLDDGNVEDHSVAFCVDYAMENDCNQCESLARLLMRMSRTQRLKLVDDPGKYIRAVWWCSTVINDKKRYSTH